jgi:predicted amidophosphoribosyltransferase
MTIIEELSQLIFPTRCFGCNAFGLTICALCQNEWKPGYYLTHISNVNVHSSILYSATASRVILAAKENGLKAADHLIMEAIAHAIRKGKFLNQSVRLVPIPSSPTARRRRGRSFMVDITQKVALKTGLPVINALELGRKVRDQSGLKASQRSLNMEGAFAIARGIYPIGKVILVDDVVTTGATLREAARALSGEGFHVIGSVTACVAQPLR